MTYEFLGTVLNQLAVDVITGTQNSALPAVGKSYLHIGSEAHSETVTGADYQEYMQKVSKIVTDANFTPIVWNEAASTAWSTLPEGTVGQFWYGNLDGV
ncbi:hypothetical protein [Bifidobacterium tsurumiense]|uniref:hypothetical protein n=1 Tax=Bifidobacterium tsurumiense TaxID=356829 RepID=UPI00041D1EB2|nr:hypothetical protein [Bifidobacterium tsurumiense]